MLELGNEPGCVCKAALANRARAQVQDTAALPGCCTAPGQPSGFCKDHIPHLPKKPGNSGSPRALISARVLCSPYQHLYRHSSCRASVQCRLCRAAAKSLLGSSWHYGKSPCVMRLISQPINQSVAGFPGGLATTSQ